MPIGNAMAALKSELAAHTGAPVHVGPPEAGRPGVYVHPYAVEETMELRSHAGNEPGMRVGVFVSAEPESDYELLSAAMRCLREHTVIVSDDVSLRLSRASFTPSEVAAIFQAMAIPYRMCVPYEVRVTPTTSDG